LAHGRVNRAMKYFGVLLGWLLLIRFAWPTLAVHPWSLRAMAVSTLVLGVHAILVRWRRAATEALPRLKSDWAEALT
jgi:hypothetical protein